MLEAMKAVAMSQSRKGRAAMRHGSSSTFSRSMDVGVRPSRAHWPDFLNVLPSHNHATGARVASVTRSRARSLSHGVPNACDAG